MADLHSILKENTWYKSYNRLFMIVDKSGDPKVYKAFGLYPEAVVKVAYLQPSSHMNVFSFHLSEWGVFITENRQYLYQIDLQDTIERHEIKKPSSSDFRKIFVGLMSYRWNVGHSTSFLNPGSSEGVRELHDIISAIRGGK